MNPLTVKNFFSTDPLQKSGNVTIRLKIKGVEMCSKIYSGGAVASGIKILSHFCAISFIILNAFGWCWYKSFVFPFAMLCHSMEISSEARLYATFSSFVFFLSTQHRGRCIRGIIFMNFGVPEIGKIRNGNWKRF